MILNIPFLTDTTLVENARKFLNDHKADSVPVDIEKIIEYDYGMDIIPMPGLRTLIDMDGFITGDFSAIYVDEWVYNTVYNRYRFTLAHEIGHYCLHRDILSQVEYDSIDAWKRFISEMDRREHSKMEYQAYAFAGLILVPQDRLKEELAKVIPNVTGLIEEAKRSKLSRETYLSYAIETVAQNLSAVFHASVDVIKRRITFDKLSEMIP